MKERELARILMKKADEDEYVVLKLLADPKASDEVIGFHAQQAVEKRIKAVLVGRAIPVRRTHDVAELIDLARDSGIGVPDEIEDARLLTPFAVDFRYGDIEGSENEPLPRSNLPGLLQSLRDWAEHLLESSSQSGEGSS